MADTGLKSMLQTAMTVRNMLADTRDRQRQLAQQKEERDYLRYQRQLQHDQMIATDIINYTSNFDNANTWINNWLKQNEGKTTQDGVEAWQMYVGQLSDLVNSNMGKYGYMPKNLYVDFSGKVSEDFANLMSRGFELESQGIDSTYMLNDFMEKNKYWLPTANTSFMRGQSEEAAAAMAAPALPAETAPQPQGQAQAQGQVNELTPEDIRQGLEDAGQIGQIDTARDTLAAVDPRFAEKTEQPAGNTAEDRRKLEQDISRLKRMLGSPKATDTEKEKWTKLLTEKEQKLDKIAQGEREAEKAAADKAKAEADSKVSAEAAAKAEATPSIATVDYGAVAYDNNNQTAEQFKAVSSGTLENSYLAAYRSMQQNARANRELKAEYDITQKRTGNFGLGDAIKSRVNNYGAQWFEDFYALSPEEQKVKAEQTLFTIVAQLKNEGLLTQKEIARYNSVLAEQNATNKPNTEAFIQEYMPFIAQDDKVYYQGQTLQDKREDAAFKRDKAIFDQLIKLDTKGLSDPASVTSAFNAIQNYYGDYIQAGDKLDAMADLVVYLADKATTSELEPKLKRQKMQEEIKKMQIDNQYAARIKEMALAKDAQSIQKSIAEVNRMMSGGGYKNGGSNYSGGSGGGGKPAYWLVNGGTQNSTIQDQTKMSAGVTQMVQNMITYFGNNPSKTTWKQRVSGFAEENADFAKLDENTQRTIYNTAVYWDNKLSQ